MTKKSLDWKKQFDEDLQEASTFKCGNCGNVSDVNAVREYNTIHAHNEEDEGPWGVEQYAAGEVWQLIFCPNCHELNLRHAYYDDRYEPEHLQPEILYPKKTISFIDSTSNLSNAMADKTSDFPPNFSKLVSNIEMREILQRRWLECINCINANAPLAAVVMTGGLLEAVLLARVNRLYRK